MADQSLSPTGLSSQQLSEIKAVFDLFDVHTTGKVDAKDVRRCLLSLGLDAKTPALFQMLAELGDANENKRYLTFDQFLQLVSCKFTGSSTYDEWFKVFQLFDPDGTGYISAPSLEAVCRDIGESFSRDEIDEMIKLADSNQDGCINMASRPPF